MTAAHTPGPWSAMPLVAQGLTFAPIVATTMIAKVYSTDYGDHEQAIANAQLMAAAPDLLEALREAMDAVKTFHGPECWDVYEQHAPEMKRWKAAIAKAEGGAA